MKTPLEILKEYRGRKVVVYLKDQTMYNGILDYIEQSQHGGIGNIILKDAMYEDYELKYKSENILIRGNSILYIQV